MQEQIPFRIQSSVKIEADRLYAHLPFLPHKTFFVKKGRQDLLRKRFRKTLKMCRASARLTTTAPAAPRPLTPTPQRAALFIGRRLKVPRPSILPLPVARVQEFVGEVASRASEET